MRQKVCEACNKNKASQKVFLSHWTVPTVLEQELFGAKIKTEKKLTHVCYWCYKTYQGE
jgi:protein-arginine kinase activator protein McsA